MTHRITERGNVFFALFGAVALVGVVGAATSTLMRGPVSTVVAVNQRAKADTQMQIASKLAMVRASEESESGDCDVDGMVEPIPHEGDVGLTGGGGLPAKIGASQIDPWNTRYGYCAWDLGSVVDDAACGDAGIRLQGGENPSYPVMVIISAGPDKLFQTTCEDWAALDVDGRPSNAATLVNANRDLGPNDDIVLAYTYDEAAKAAGGLWSLMSGEPDTITTDKNVAFSSGTTANFQGTAQFSQDSRLDLRPKDIHGNSLGGGTFLLPTQDDLDLCNAANDGALRVNTDPDYVIVDTEETTILEICDKNTGAFEPVGGKGVTFKVGGDNGELQFNSSGALDGASGLIWAPGSGYLGIGASPTATLDVTGTVKISETLNVIDSVTAPHFNFDASNGLSHDAGGIDVNSATGISLNSTTGIDFNAGGHSMVLTSDGNLGIGIPNPNDALEVDGDAQISGETLSRRFVASYLGSAGAPAFSFGSSSGLGFYATSDDIGFSVGGSTQALLNATGLGIGTTPDVALDVLGAGQFTSVVTATGFQFSSGQGLFQDGSGLTLDTGSGPQFFLSGIGNVGIGQASPSTALDVNGAVRVGYVGDAACTAERTGALRYYEAGDVLQVCSTNGTFETIGTSGGGGGGSGSHWTKISNIDPRLYYTAGAVGVGVADPLATLHADGNFLVTGTHGAGSDVPLEGAGTRTMFMPKKGAFRVGGVDGTQWDEENIGDYSLGLGYNTISLGNYSVSLGNFTRSLGWGSVAIGTSSIAAGNASIAIGRNVLVGSEGNVTLGDGSIGYGLGTPSGVFPQVTGNSTYGIFMGDQSGVNIATDNLMALVGGRMVIDPTPTGATHVVPSGSLALDVHGDIGAAQYCDEDGANCFTSGSVGSAHGADGEIQFASAGQFLSSPDLMFSDATKKLQVGGTVQAQGLILDPVTGADVPLGMMLSDLWDTAIDTPTSGDLLSFNGSKWENISAGSLSPSAAGANRQIQFNSNGSFDANSNLIYSAGGALMVAGTHTGAGSPPATGAGTRMFFDPAKSAFRAGAVAGTQWDNPGIYSFAGGLNTTASGTHSVAIGRGGTASGNFSVALGDAPVASGPWSTALGTQTVASGQYSTALGTQTVASGDFSTAIGAVTTASNSASIAMGRSVVAAGVSSMGIGLTNASLASPPQVTGNQSLGIFMGNHPTNVMSAANTMGVFGGKMVIDPAVPATQLTARSVIDVGAATDSIVMPAGTTAQRPTSPVSGMLRYNSTNQKFEGYQGASWNEFATGSSAAGANRQIQFNSNGSFDANSNLIYSADGAFMVAGTYAGAGSPPASGGGVRMFFDPAKAAFRAGFVTAAQWDAGSIGNQSMGLGTNTVASGQWSAAIGRATTASGETSTAMGDTTTASGQYSTSMGVATNATGANSIAMGQSVMAGNGTPNAAGNGSMAIGLTTAIPPTPPQVTGNQSLGIFMGNHTTKVMSAANTMGVFGGRLIIDPTVPASKLAASAALDVVGDIQYTGTLTDVSDMRLKTDIHPLRDRGSMLDKLGQVDTYSFHMKNDPSGPLEFGVMAQEMQKVFPELVKIDNGTPEKYMSVNYIGLIAPLVQATRELKAENDHLKSQLGALEGKMASLESDMKGLKAHTGYGIDKAGFGMGMAAGLLLVGGLGGAFMAGRRRKAA